MLPREKFANAARILEPVDDESSPSRRIESDARSESAEVRDIADDNSL
jgi:regulator of extracellular matrix RemA (YlzA/DUF370 family)